jgi:hypothetical protein
MKSILMETEKLKAQRYGKATHQKSTNIDNIFSETG